MVHRSVTPTLLSLALGFLLGLALPILSAAPAPSAARELTPPELGAVILEDPLTAPGTFGPPGVCPSGKNRRDFVGEGAIIKVAGKCTDSSTNASLAYQIAGLTVSDGEARLEFKAVSGQDRVLFALDVRAQASLRDGSYSFRVDPAAGVVQLRHTADGQSTVLAERADLADVLAPADWNSLAVRLQGPDLWLLLNDQLVLSASDGTFDTGAVWIGLLRTGDPNDPQETAVVMRNLRISGLADGEQARLPTYQPSQPVASVAPRGAPWIGDLAFGYNPEGVGTVPAGGKLPDRTDGDIYGFFSWRDLPPGSRIGVQVLWGGEVQAQDEFSPNQPDGRTWIGILSFGSPEGGARFTFADVGLVVLLDGKELARGSVALP